MSNQFFILVDKRDLERFRQFMIGKFNAETNDVLQKNNSRFIWPLHQSYVTPKTWKKIRSKDIVLFTIPKNNFQIVGKVSKKIFDKKLSSVVCPDTLNQNQIFYFLMFDELTKVNLPYHEVLDKSSAKIQVPIPGLYEIKRESQLQFEFKTKSMSEDLRPKTFIQPSLSKGPAKQHKSEVNRFVRDSKIVKKLKELYDNRCQICNFTFSYQKNKHYSEVHHYNPLEEGGNDDIDNMIVVCSNHHAQLDYKVLAISYDGKHVIDRNGRIVSKIHFRKDHKLSKKNIQSQLEEK